VTPETVPVDILVVLSIAAAVVGLLVAAFSIWVELQTRAQLRRSNAAADRLRHWLAGASSAVTADEVLKQIDKIDAEERKVNLGR
jgi:hypothetical protein